MYKETMGQSSLRSLPRRPDSNTESLGPARAAGARRQVGTDAGRQGGVGQEGR